jgi:hypothetical protein
LGLLGFHFSVPLLKEEMVIPHPLVVFKALHAFMQTRSRLLHLNLPWSFLDIRNHSLLVRSVLAKSAFDKNDPGMCHFPGFLINCTVLTWGPDVVKPEDFREKWRFKWAFSVLKK